MVGVAWYVPEQPPVELASVLVCGWTARPRGRCRLTPDGCCDLLYIHGVGLYQCGPEDRSWRFELPAGTTAVGVRFRPGVVGIGLEADVSLWFNRRGPLGEMAPAVAEPAGRLEQAMAAMPDDRSRLDALYRFVAGLTWPADQVESINRLTDRATGDQALSVAELADETGYSQRQLHRLARRHYGYGLATLHRLVRFQRLQSLVDAAVAAGTSPTLSDLAALAGYSDHAHLGRDCRSITGCTPTEFLADWFATFPDMSDPYKTGTPLADTLSP